MNARTRGSRWARSTNRMFLPLLYVLFLAVGPLHAAAAQEPEEDGADETELPACPAAELAADRQAARSYVLSAAQLKGLTDASVELQAAARTDAALAASVQRFRCQMDSDRGTTTETLTTVGAGRWFASSRKVAEVHARHGLTARDVALWGYLAQYLAFAASPEIAALAPDVAAAATRQLSAQQAAFAKQNRAGLKVWFESGRRRDR